MIRYFKIKEDLIKWNNSFSVLTYALLFPIFVTIICMIFFPNHNCNDTAPPDFGIWNPFISILLLIVILNFIIMTYMVFKIFFLFPINSLIIKYQNPIEFSEIKEISSVTIKEAKDKHSPIFVTLIFKDNNEISVSLEDYNKLGLSEENNKILIKGKKITCISSALIDKNVFTFKYLFNFRTSCVYDYTIYKPFIETVYEK